MILKQVISTLSLEKDAVSAEHFYLPRGGTVRRLCIDPVESGTTFDWKLQDSGDLDLSAPNPGVYASGLAASTVDDVPTVAYLPSPAAYIIIKNLGDDPSQFKISMIYEEMGSGL